LVVRTPLPRQQGCEGHPRSDLSSNAAYLIWTDAQAGELGIASFAKQLIVCVEEGLEKVAPEIGAHELRCGTGHQHGPGSSGGIAQKRDPTICESQLQDIGASLLKVADLAQLDAVADIRALK
jgi:hypothetical protein